LEEAAGDFSLSLDPSGDEAPLDPWRNSPEIQSHLASLGLENVQALRSWVTTQLSTFLPNGSVG
jgi:N-acetyl-beta-hexosaminidase